MGADEEGRRREERRRRAAGRLGAEREKIGRCVWREKRDRRLARRVQGALRQSKKCK